MPIWRPIRIFPYLFLLPTPNTFIQSNWHYWTAVRFFSGRVLPLWQPLVLLAPWSLSCFCLFCTYFCYHFSSILVLNAPNVKHFELHSVYERCYTNKVYYYCCWSVSYRRVYVGENVLTCWAASAGGPGGSPAPSAACGWCCAGGCWGVGGTAGCCGAPPGTDATPDCPPRNWRCSTHLRTHLTEVGREEREEEEEGGGERVREGRWREDRGDNESLRVKVRYANRDIYRMRADQKNVSTVLYSAALCLCLSVPVCFWKSESGLASWRKPISFY